jgi:thymidylate synthase (FAD)
MQLINQSYEIIPQASRLEGIYKHIEKAGRTCYKSEDKITEDSAEKFVERMINSKHTAMLEHGTVYLKFKWWQIGKMIKYGLNKYSKGFKNVTTNFRVIIENDWVKDLKYLCEPTKRHEKRITVKFITDQGILREFTRHRVFSFAVESTRYCNYSKDKFGNEITYILPNWIDENMINPQFKWNTSDDWGNLICEYYYNITEDGQKHLQIDNLDIRNFLFSLSTSEQIYFSLLNQGWAPQQARNVLPLATKCDMVMTGFVSDWKHFFDLRAIGTTGKPHPQAKELAEPLMGEFRTLGYI